jgi:predicted transcriptional regulator
MMMRSDLPIPTESELELLNVLWEKGPATVREVHDAIARERDLGYTTVLKIFQRMTEKGLVQREESAKAHTYRPTVTQQETQSQMLRDLSDRLFSGSSTQLAMHALSMKAPNAEELEDVRKILEQRGGKK